MIAEGSPEPMLEPVPLMENVTSTTDVFGEDELGPRSEKSQPLLTICIPTYKRARHSLALAQTIVSGILENDRYNVNLVVVNNASPDDTKERLATISHPDVEIVNLNEHLDTAEENVIRSLKYVTGEYVWFLGDDDIIYLNNFSDHYRMLESNQHDLLIFNSSLISPTGKLVRQQTMKMNGWLLELPLDDLVERIGLLFTFAGVSNLIQRTSLLNMEDGLEWLKTAKIYSHVAWIIDHHRKSRAVLVNSPLVFYRQNDYTDGHWERVAERQKVQNLYFWSLGLVKLIGRLVDRGALSYAQAGLIFEQAADGSRYRLLDDIIFKTFEQICLGASTGEYRQQFSSEEFEEIAEFILNSDPMTFDLVESLKEGYSAIVAARSDPGAVKAALGRLKDRFTRLHADRQEAGQFFTRFTAKLYDYDVYRLQGLYIAVPEHDPSLRDEVLRTVDPVERGMRVLISSSLKDVEIKIREAYTARQALAPAEVSNDGEITRLLNEQFHLNKGLTSTLSAVYASTSWRLTGPLRRIVKMLRRST